MITKQDLERLISREPGGRPVISLFLDMSVNQNNKRQWDVFLSQKRTQLEEIEPELVAREGPAVDEVTGRIRSWIADDFDQSNRGVVIYAEVGGDYFEAMQFPVPVQNRMVVADRPMVGPLAQVLESYHHYGVILLDREHVRILSVYLGSLLDEIERHGDPLPVNSHIKAGGYSQSRIQRRKAEEMRHFFKDFAAEVEVFVDRYHPQDLVLLGTEENTAKFREFLPDSILQRVVHTGNMWVDEPAAGVMEKLEPLLRADLERREREVVEQLKDRVAHDYLATAGFQGTLTALQEGKVDTLVLASDHRQDGVRCGQCGFVFARELKTCPYDGSSTLEGVDVVEEMVRMAEGQGVQIAFAAPAEVQELKGAGALLRF
ncbi:MAG TPA: Vms1/Ankzf1 family peptidyl-tRNA hydrolase [Longimicrobium sp.]|nr:Vms1/Ankzf1 family peptidyl-tRNA hydrolase [Longimicrobium sp.]